MRTLLQTCLVITSKMSRLEGKCVVHIYIYIHKVFFSRMSNHEIRVTRGSESKVISHSRFYQSQPF